MVRTQVATGQGILCCTGSTSSLALVIRPANERDTQIPGEVEEIGTRESSFVGHLDTISSRECPSSPPRSCTGKTYRPKDCDSGLLLPRIQ